MAGHICPQCGTDSRPDGGTGARPACACGQPTAEQYRTAERHRAEWSAADKAEMAAAEDFDPLRIRPYVTLGNDTVPAAADADERPEQRGSHRPRRTRPRRCHSSPARRRARWNGLAFSDSFLYRDGTK